MTFGANFLAGQNNGRASHVSRLYNMYLKLLSKALLAASRSSRRSIRRHFFSWRRFAFTMKLIERNNNITDDRQYPIHSVQKATSNSELLSAHSSLLLSIHSYPLFIPSGLGTYELMTGSAASSQKSADQQIIYGKEADLYRSRMKFLRMVLAHIIAVSMSIVVRVVAGDCAVYYCLCASSKPPTSLRIVGLLTGLPTGT
jgi:hypothetical protein